MICNEQNKSVRDVWDAETLKLTFRRNFDNKMMEQWYQLVEIAKEITFDGDSDALIWQLENKGVYSSSSLYHVINFRGIQPLFLPAVWKLVVPPKNHVFLWLFSQNKLMTRDILRKRHIIKPLDCVFCTEQETNHHLFFDCVVARNIWSFVNLFFQKNLGTNFESVARFWISNKKNLALNVVSSTVLWCLWKYRNSMIFNNTIWTSINQVWRLIHRMLKFWVTLTPEASKSRVEELLQQPLMISSG